MTEEYITDESGMTIRMQTEIDQTTLHLKVMFQVMNEFHFDMKTGEFFSTPFQVPKGAKHTDYSNDL